MQFGPPSLVQAEQNEMFFRDLRGLLVEMVLHLVGHNMSQL